MAKTLRTRFDNGLIRIKAAWAVLTCSAYAAITVTKNDTVSMQFSITHESFMLLVKSVDKAYQMHDADASLKKELKGLGIETQA